MKSLENDIELIERYFDNTLSAEESSELNMRMQNDPEFRRLFNREKLLVHTIRVEGAAGNLEYLKELEKNLAVSGTQRQRTMWYALAAAASIALVALVIWMPWARESPDTLYAEYFQPHPNVFAPAVRGDERKQDATRAFQYYEQQDYEQAAALFSDLLEQQPDAGMLMLLGNCNLMLGKTEAAAENFRDLIDNFDELDIAGKWYLSLAYLKSAAPQDAINVLQEVEKSSSPYADKASQLLSELGQ